MKKRSINEIESVLIRVKEHLDNSNPHGEKRAYNSTRNSREQIQYIQVPAHTEYKGGRRSDMKDLNRMTPTLEHHPEKMRT